MVVNIEIWEWDILLIYSSLSAVVAASFWLDLLSHNIQFLDYEFWLLSVEIEYS